MKARIVVWLIGGLVGTGVLWHVYSTIYDRGYAAAKSEWDAAIDEQERQFAEEQRLAMQITEGKDNALRELRDTLTANADEKRRLRDELEAARVRNVEPAGRRVPVDETGTCFVYDPNPLRLRINAYRHPSADSVSAANQSGAHPLP